jgi:hypothetical protein
VKRSNSFDELPSTYCCGIEASQASKLGDESVLVGGSFRHYKVTVAAAVEDERVGVVGVAWTR